jgi:hypothetical protein
MTGAEPVPETLCFYNLWRWKKSKNVVLSRKPPAYATNCKLSCCCRGLGFWCHMYLQVDADVSEKHAVSIFRCWSDTPLHTQPPPCDLPEGFLLVRIRFPYSLWLASCPQPLLFTSYINPSTSLPCHFNPWRWRQHVYPKRQHDLQIHKMPKPKISITTW